MKVTRRQIAIAVAAAPVAAASLAAQTAPPSAIAQPSPNSLEKAQDEIRQNSERLRKLDVPMSLEPAFSFRP